MARGRKPCTTCLRIRMFVFCALPLIIMIGLRPEGLVNLASKFPDSWVIAAAMMAVGTLSFIYRYLKYKSRNEV